MNQFVIGQPVTCCVLAGVWCVAAVRECHLGQMDFFRYTLRRGSEYHYDMVEVWLSPVRLGRPSLYVVGQEKPTVWGKSTGGDAA